MTIECLRASVYRNHRLSYHQLSLCLSWPIFSSLKWRLESIVNCSEHVFELIDQLYIASYSTTVCFEHKRCKELCTLSSLHRDKLKMFKFSLKFKLSICNKIHFSFYIPLLTCFKRVFIIRTLKELLIMCLYTGFFN